MISSLQNLSQKRKSKSVSSFINKTYDLLKDEQNQKIVRWSHNGIGFVVLNQEHFAKLILPKYFKHSNYSSFVRQLNMYNFHKIREQNGESYFHHEHFDRDNRSSLSEIKRKPEKKKRTSIDQDESVFDDLQSHVNRESSHKENQTEHIQTPNSFSPDGSSKMLSQDGECVDVKSKCLQQNQKLMNTTRQLFSSQFTLKFENPAFQSSSSSKKINQHFFQCDQEDDDKISINDDIEERLIPFPTKEFMYPSKNNLFQLGNVKDMSSFDIFF